MLVVIYTPRLIHAIIQSVGRPGSLGILVLLFLCVTHGNVAADSCKNYLCNSGFTRSKYILFYCKWQKIFLELFANISPWVKDEILRYCVFKLSLTFISLKHHYRYPQEFQTKKKKKGYMNSMHARSGKFIKLMSTRHHCLLLCVGRLLYRDTSQPSLFTLT